MQPPQGAPQFPTSGAVPSGEALISMSLADDAGVSGGSTPEATTLPAAPATPHQAGAPAGISAEQLVVWETRFDAKVGELLVNSKSLMSEDKAVVIIDLLKTWDAVGMTPALRKAKTPNYIYFHNMYTLGPLDTLLKIENGSQKRVVAVDTLFDELLQVHVSNNHGKGKMLHKKAGEHLAGVTQTICHMPCVLRRLPCVFRVKGDEEAKGRV